MTSALQGQLLILLYEGRQGTAGAPGVKREIDAESSHLQEVSSLQPPHPHPTLHPHHLALASGYLQPAPHSEQKWASAPMLLVGKDEHRGK